MPRVQKYDMLVERDNVWEDEDSEWEVRTGILKPDGGRLVETGLFRIIGERLPFSCLRKIQAHVQSRGIDTTGVYVVFNSDEIPCYVGIGQIFRRLRAHRAKHGRVVAYFSFYVLRNRNHMREIETILVRTFSRHLDLNVAKRLKKETVISPRYYEVGTIFYQRMAANRNENNIDDKLTLRAGYGYAAQKMCSGRFAATASLEC